MNSASSLVARLRWLGAQGHPLGIDDQAAERLRRLFESGATDPPARVVPAGDPRLASVLAAVDTGDIPARWSATLDVAHEVIAHERKVAGAATYPAMLALSVTAAATVLWTVGGPALAALPDAGSNVDTPLLVAACVAAGTLALLAAAVAGRVRLERIDPGWARLDGLAFVGLVRALHAQGLDLAAAAAAASGWCRGAEAEAAKQVGRDLAAGADALQGGRLLDSFEAGLLAAAAREGVAAAALDALWLSRQHVAQREIPGAVARVEFLALAIAGCGVLAMAVGFALAYGRALVGA